MMKIAVVGFGYWGPNLVRNFSTNPSSEVGVVCDLDDKKLLKAQNIYPHLKTTTELDEILENKDIEAVAIATPIASHFKIAKKSLLAGKHVFLEKPITDRVEHAEELYSLAKNKKLCLFVDHVYLYQGAVRKIREIVKRGQIGKINYFDSVRVNLGLFQKDSNVLWDLAVHDLSILNFLTNEKPDSVIASGVSHEKNMMENIVYVTLRYSSGLLAHIHCSWTAPVKVRRITIGGSKKMIVYDDVEPTEKIKLYDTGYKVRSREKLLVDYRVGDIHIPKFDHSEALAIAVSDFIGFVENKKPPNSNISIGRSVVKILESAQTSLKSNGKEVFLRWK